MQSPKSPSPSSESGPDHSPLESDPTKRPPPEIVYVNTRTPHCDGGEGALGHPRVYLNMGDNDFVDCPYCDRRYVFKASE